MVLIYTIATSVVSSTIPSMASVVVMLEHVLVQRPVLVVPDGDHVCDGDGSRVGPRGGAGTARHLDNVTCTRRSQTRSESPWPHFI